MLAIASLSVRETASRRFAWIVAFATVAAVALSTWGFTKLGASVHPRYAAAGLEAGLVIFLGFGFSVVLAIGAAFVAAPAIAGEVERGIVLAVLPRPISRADYVFGKWLGTSALVAAYALVAGALELAALDATTGYLPPHPLLALAYLVAEALAMLTLALTLGTRLPAIASGILALALFGAGWIAGIAGAIARSLGNAAILHATTVVGLVVPTDVLWRGAVFALEPAMFLMAQDNLGDAAARNPFAVAAPPTTAFLVWTALWFVAVLAFGIANFARRDV